MDDIYLKLVEEQKNPGISQKVEAQDVVNEITAGMLKSVLARVESLEKSLNLFWCVLMGLIACAALRVLTIYF